MLNQISPMMSMANWRKSVTRCDVSPVFFILLIYKYLLLCNCINLYKYILKIFIYIINIYLYIKINVQLATFSKAEGHE